MVSKKPEMGPWGAKPEPEKVPDNIRFRSSLTTLSEEGAMLSAGLMLFAGLIGLAGLIWMLVF